MNPLLEKEVEALQELGFLNFNVCGNNLELGPKDLEIYFTQALERVYQSGLDKGYDFAKQQAQVEADEKFETMGIILLRDLLGGEGEYEIKHVEAMTAKNEWVLFSREDLEGMTTKFKLVKESTPNQTQP